MAPRERFADGPTLSSTRPWADLPVRRHSMSCRANHRHPSPWPLILMATLAVSPGCSIEPEPQGELISFINSHGTISYRWVPNQPPVLEAPIVVPSPPLVVPNETGAEAKER